MKKKVLLVALVAVFCLAVLVGVGVAQSKVIVGLVSDPQNIGPFQGMSQGRIGVLYTMYEFLAVTEGGEMYGVLMKDYERVDDLTYDVEIYNNIYALQTLPI